MLGKNPLSALQALTRSLKSGVVSNSRTIVRRFILQPLLVDAIIHKHRPSVWLVSSRSLLMTRLSTLVARTPSIMANGEGYPESRNRRMTARPPYPCLSTIPSHSSVANHENLSASGAGSDASSFYFRLHSQSHSHIIQPYILDRIRPSPCRR